MNGGFTRRVLWQYGCQDAKNYGLCLAMAALPLPMLIFFVLLILLLNLHILLSAVVGDWAGLLGILLKTFTASCADAATALQRQRQRQRHSGSKNKRIVRCLLQKRG